MSNYILMGGYDSLNVGDYAMLDTLTRVLHGHTITLLTRHQHDHLPGLWKVRLLQNLDHETREASKGRMFNGFNYGDDTRHLHDIRKALLYADGLILGGGRLLVDYCLSVGRGPLWYYQTLITLARFCGVPVSIYGMSIVPLATQQGADLLRYIVGCCERVAVRDEGSVDVLRMYDCPLEHVTVLPDPAYALPWRQREGGTKRAGLSVRRMDEQYGGIPRARYIELMSATIDTLHNEGYEVVGIPHQYYDMDRPDDSDLRVIADLPVDEVAWYGQRTYVLEAYEKLYRSLDLCVGIRRHSTIFAALCGVPVRGVAENVNAERALDEVGAVHVPIDRVADSAHAGVDCAKVKALGDGLVERYQRWLGAG